MIALIARLSVPAALKPKAAYTLGELCHRAGFGLRIADTDDADIHYTDSRTHDSSAAVVIRCHAKLYDPATVCAVHTRGGKTLWEDGALSNAETADLIGGAYRLLTLLDESQVANDARDGRGSFMVNSLPQARQASSAIPLVDCHADALGEAVIAVRPECAAAAAPRWPGAKRHAIVVTHDCDHVRLGAPAEIAVNTAKAILRGSLLYARLAAIGATYMLRPSQDPFCSFAFWREWEAERGIKGAYYLFVRPPGVRVHLNDCKSTARSSALDWPLLRQMAATGTEFGLHAPIGMRHRPEAFREAREWLEDKVGAPVVGVRHHYFALDWVCPYKSHRMHADAGFQYDSSVAFRDVPGFRSGTAMPYRAFDPVLNQEIPLTVLPCSLMDGHVLAGNGEHRPGVSGSGLIETVREAGGATVLNWHQESAFNRLIYDGYVDALDELLALDVARDGWMTTPRELCQWWERRSMMLDQSDTLPSVRKRHRAAATGAA